MFLTVAVDLVICGIQEPVRFAIETKAKIFPHNERFWYFTKKPHQEQFFVKLKLVSRFSDYKNYWINTLKSHHYNDDPASTHYNIW